MALWAGADVILTPNGAHFVNAPFMRAGGVLLEGVPWAMREYVGQLAITSFSLLYHRRLHSARPPFSRALAPFNTVESEDKCAANEICRRRFRDHSLIWTSPSELVGVLSLVPALQAQLNLSAVERMSALASDSRPSAGETCEDTPYWMNYYGRTCEDYSREGDPTGVGIADGGGWCTNGSVKASATWATGQLFAFPEVHCCACGRKVADINTQHIPSTLARTRGRRSMRKNGRESGES